MENPFQDYDSILRRYRVQPCVFTLILFTGDFGVEVRVKQIESVDRVAVLEHGKQLMQGIFNVVFQLDDAVGNDQAQEGRVNFLTLRD